LIDRSQAFNTQHNEKLATTIETGAAGGMTPALAGAEGEDDSDNEGVSDLPGTGTARITAGVNGGNSSREAGYFNGWWWVHAAAEEGNANRETFKSYPVFFVEVDIARNQELFNALSTQHNATSNQ
jgi:hypothetical protein